MGKIFHTLALDPKKRKSPTSFHFVFPNDLFGVRFAFALVKQMSYALEN